MTALPATDLERRKQVRLRLRPDLVLTRQHYEGQACCVVKDPVSLRYYHFAERDHFLLQLLDGRHTLDEVQRAFEDRYRPQRLGFEDLEALGHLLLQAGLAHHDLPQAGQQLWERRRRRRRLEWVRRLTNVLYIEVPLFDPDALLGRLTRGLDWLLRPWFLALGVVGMVAALLVVGLHFDTFWGRLPSFEEFFRFRNLVHLWLALGLVKILHELGHGLACKRLGGEVHDFGLLLMCLSPCLYVNTSDAWTLPDKWRRMCVGLAGIYVELLVAAAATFVWWSTPGDLLASQLSLSLMIVCGVNTVFFNGNPLLRFDGYYVLADWLEIPNLRERCNAAFRRWFTGTCLGIEQAPAPPMDWWRRGLFVGYAAASFLYGWVVTFGVIWFLTSFLKPYKLGMVGVLLAVLTVASLTGWPLYRFAQGWKQRGRLPTMQPRRVTLTGGLAAMLLLAFLFLPLPISRIRETALVQPRPEAVARIYLPQSASLERLHVRDGQAVEAGDLLAEFRSLELESRLEEARSQHAVRLVQAKALRHQLADAVQPAERARLELGLAQADGERELFARQIALEEKKLRALVLRAPRAGVVLAPPRRDEVGKLWEKEQGTPVCSIGDPTRLRVLAPVEPADYRLLQEDLAGNRALPATIRVQGWGSRTWPGKLAPLPASAARDVPVGLTARAGGPVAIQPGAAADSRVPQAQVYLVAVDFQDAERAGIWSGCQAQVKIHCRWRPASWWLWRKLSSTFDLGLVG